jgi:hypothetical protein
MMGIKSGSRSSRVMLSAAVTLCHGVGSVCSTHTVGLMATAGGSGLGNLQQEDAVQRAKKPLAYWQWQCTLRRLTLHTPASQRQTLQEQSAWYEKITSTVSTARFKFVHGCLSRAKSGTAGVQQEGGWRTSSWAAGELRGTTGIKSGVLPATIAFRSKPGGVAETNRWHRQKHRLRQSTVCMPAGTLRRQCRGLSSGGMPALHLPRVACQATQPRTRHSDLVTPNARCTVCAPDRET